MHIDEKKIKNKKLLILLSKNKLSIVANKPNKAKPKKALSNKNLK
jgi:hypothetical protein